MATNCEDVSAQMMELLYGELPADARANVDAHVAGCARCRSELDSFEKTRTVARRGLDEEPPARARAAILQAAAAHVAAQARPAARKPAAPDPVSFWDRIRARWAFPTLATVGAVAVFLVANRVFLNPERALDQQRRALETEAPVPAVAAPVAPAAPPEPAALPRARARAVSDDALEGLDQAVKSGASTAASGERPPAPRMDAPPRDLKPTSESGRAGDHRGLGKDAAKGEKPEIPKMKAKKAEDDVARFAEPPPPPAKPAPVPEFEKRQFAPPPPPRESQPTARHKEADKALMADDVPLGSVATKSAPAARRSAPSTPSPLDGLTMGDAERPAGSAAGVAGGGAGPKKKADGFGSGAAQAAPAPRPPAVENQAAKRASPPPAVTAAAPATAPVMAAPPSPAPPPPPQQTKSRPRRAEAESAADEGSWAQESDAKEEKKQKGGKGSAAETLMQRADRLFAEGRWAEAAAVYRELLRREPQSGDADRWRRRLATAENADVSERNARARASRKPAPAKAAAEADGAATK